MADAADMKPGDTHQVSETDMLQKGAATSATTEGMTCESAALHLENTIPRSSTWHPRSWGKKIWIAISLILLVIIGAILGGVFGSRAVKYSKYPMYSPLNYTLVDTYGGESFFDNFYYHNGSDPAGGFVQYIDAEASAKENLTYASTDRAILRASLSPPKNATSGRRSARIVSKRTYDTGLFIFNVIRIPYGCSLWPALWLVNEDDWPLHGEIDIIEGVNNGVAGKGRLDHVGNHATLYTNGGCTMDVQRRQTGSVTQTDCHNSTNYNAGCGVIASGENSTYGEPFNAAGGGVYAMEWRSAGIRVWSWTRDGLPSDIASVLASNGTASDVPDPSTWSEPMADFPNTDCDMSTHFTN